MAGGESEILIVGGGPGGVSALLWCHSLGLRATLIEGQNAIGGQMLKMHHRVTDYAGVSARDGETLAQHFANQLDDLRLEYTLGTQVIEVDLPNVRVRTPNAWLSARAIIIATGQRKRRLGVPGEERFAGSGVSDSATRDHPAFAGREVVVVGGGDSAFEGSLMLARVCPKVTLVHHSEKFRARTSWIEEVLSNPKIKVLTNTTVSSIEGETSPSRVITEDIRTGERREINAQGVFIRLGMTPNSELFAHQLQSDSSGFVMTDQWQQTTAKAVFAVGDVCGGISHSIANAVGQGAVAAKAIAQLLRQAG